MGASGGGCAGLGVAVLRSAAEVEAAEAARLLLEWREALRARCDARDCLERAQREYQAAVDRVGAAEVAVHGWVER